MVVHYPAFMTRAGDYTVQLGPAEIRALLAGVVDRGFVDLDEAEARQALSPRSPSRAGQPAQLFAVFDEPTSSIELNLESYRAPGSRASPRRDLKREVRFYAVRAHARRYPGNAALQDLAAVQDVLLEILQREDLERVP